MKPLARLILLAILAAPVLSGCGLLPDAGPVDFDSLARRVPGDAAQTIFIDFKPTGQAGRYWERIRNRLQASPQAQDLVAPIFSEFHIQDLGLDSFVVGPAVNGHLNSGTQYVILPVSSLAAARDAVLLQDRDNMDWKREEYQGRSLYHHRDGYLNGQPLFLAMAAYDDLLALTISYDHDPVEDLKLLVSLPEAQSLASLPSWKTLRARLPASPMGLVFLNLGGQAQQIPPPGVETSPALALTDRIVTLALAAVPEADGLRLEIAGELATQNGMPSALQRLLQLPQVDPASWDGLPGNTAVAVSTHDAATVWPVLSQIFPFSGLDSVRDNIGLDLEADLFATGGPFSGDLAMAITPPLPSQPISQGLAAGQLLLLGRGTSPEQMHAVQEAIESRGAILGTQTVDGTELQIQVGTELTGYAISLGFDQDLFLVGTSPTIVGQSISARRNKDGLAADPAFQAVVGKMGQAPVFFVYVDTASLIDLEQANTAAQQYGQSTAFPGLEGFDAIGLGLRFTADGIEGTAHFYMHEE